MADRGNTKAARPTNTKRTMMVQVPSNFHKLPRLEKQKLLGSSDIFLASTSNITSFTVDAINMVLK